MTRIYGLLASSAFVCMLPQVHANENPTNISADAIMNHVRTLSDMSLLGRRAGTAFERRTITYISQQLAALNIKPLPSGERIQSFRLSMNENSPTSANVFGLISPQREPELEDVIILGAHLDHLGESEEGGFHPGADDNASGVAVVLELGRVLQLHAMKLRRPVVLVFFGAEEIGLIGSNRFIRGGPIKHSRILTMVNIDMIGRPLLDQANLSLLKGVLKLDSQNSIGVIGTVGRPFFKKSVEDACARAELKPYGTQGLLSPVVKMLARNRSDHSPFERVGIPTLFFSSGESDDYHQPSDTADKLNPELISRRAKVIYDTIMTLANAPREKIPLRENALAPAGKNVKTLIIREGNLVVHLQDNSASPQILSGLQSLTHSHAANFDAFDPDSPSSSAGLNFEHIISGHRNRSNSFTPRRGKYELYASKDKKTGTLIRMREDSPWDMSSSLKYTVKKPHYVDFEFRCSPRSSRSFGTRGHAICFFANYMNDVQSPAIHFLGVKSKNEKSSWLTGDPPNTHPDWNQGGTYRHINATDVEYDDNHNFKLNSWSYDSPRYTKPFYYGRAERGMVFILMFDRGFTSLDEIRFSVFKFKLPEKPRPAWDFQYVIHRVVKNKQYGFRGRLVWKPWISQEDCLEEYEKWSQSL